MMRRRNFSGYSRPWPIRLAPFTPPLNGATLAAHRYRLQQAAEVVKALDATDEPPNVIRLTA